MRIPVSVSDIESKSFSKVAKTLRKRWPADSLSSMQAQNLLASFLGYRDLHDLQSNLVPPITLNYKAKAQFQRREVNLSIAWDISRRHAMAYGAALSLVESLPLKMLEFDNLTTDRHTEALFEAERQAGRFLVMDEYHQYANGPAWFEGTPLLLEAGAPEYRFVILPNGKAIRWSNIEDRVRHLPADLPARLRAEARYQNLASDDQVMVSFYRDEILPNVLESAPEAIQAELELAPGFELKAYSERSLVLYNKSLGGLLPIIYDECSMKVFEDMQTLLCSGTVKYGAENFVQCSSRGLWFEPHGPLAEPVGKKWPVDRFLESSFAWAMPGIAPVVVEMGQEYIRCYEWIDETHIPKHAIGWFNVTPKRLAASTYAIPKWHHEFHEHVNQVLNAKASHAVVHIADGLSSGRLLELIMRLAGDTSAVEARTLKRIEDWHPSTPRQERGFEVEHDQDTLDEYQREHDEALAHYYEVGSAIAEAYHEVASLGASTLGWLYYQHYDTAYDCRDAWLVEPFHPSKRAQVRAYFAFLLYHFSATASDSSSSYGAGKGEGKALQIMVAEVLEGRCEPHNLVKEYSRLTYLTEQLRKQDSQIEEIEVWRRKMQYMRLHASKGQYLYSGAVVPKHPPEPFLSKMFRQARSLNAAPMYITQKISDFHGLSKQAEIAVQPQDAVRFMPDKLSNIDRTSFDD